MGWCYSFTLKFPCCAGSVLLVSPYSFIRTACGLGNSQWDQGSSCSSIPWALKNIWWTAVLERARWGCTEKLLQHDERSSQTSHKFLLKLIFFHGDSTSQCQSCQSPATETAIRDLRRKKIPLFPTNLRFWKQISIIGQPSLVDVEREAIFSP